MKNKKLEVVLISPYTGGNIGDGAIQDAVIHNFRKRTPGIDILLVCMRPEIALKMHGVHGFPISQEAMIAVDWDETLKPENKTSKNSSITRALTYRIKSMLQSVCWLELGIKKILKWLRFSIYMLLWIPRELVHIRKGIGVLQGAEFIIASGGGQLDDYWGGFWRHPYSLLKWSLIAKIVNTKFLFLSIGLGTLESPISKIFVHQSLKLAFYRSYRDETTKCKLKTMRVTRKDPVYPDLVFSYQSKTINQTWACQSVKKLENGINVAINPIAYLSPDIWPKKNSVAYELYVMKLVHFIELLVSQKHSIILLTTEKHDQPLAKRIFDDIFIEASNESKQCISIFFVNTAEEFLAQLKDVECVVASRFHAILLSQMMLKPVLAISYDRKVKTHMEAISLSEYCFDINCIEAVILENTFNKMVLNLETIRANLRKINLEYRRQLDEQYNVIMGSGI
jgi:polysaccharide pyruvyl transferase WcaK-like protein